MRWWPGDMDITADHSRPLRLFWWRGVPNFGDALSQLVTARVSGRAVVQAGAGDCDMVGLGSLLQVMRRKYRTARADGVRPWIWGSGLLSSVPSDFLDHVRIALLRGPVTAALLGIRARAYGDPGLLADDMVAPPPRRDRIGLIPHHTQIADPAIRALAASDPAYDLIDVGAPVLDVVRDIASCAHVVSSSLHGLVVADAFGVASTWADPGGQGLLKYHDYAASVGRDLATPMSWPDAVRHAARSNAGPERYRDGIHRARAALRESFPEDLCAGAMPVPRQTGGAVNGAPQ